VTKQLQKNQSGQTTEVIVLERDYTNGSLETNNEYQVHPVVSYEKVTADVYVPGSTTKKLTTVTESSFDTITRHLTHRKITDVRLAQTFEEEHQYQKLGNAYYQTSVFVFFYGSLEVGQCLLPDCRKKIQKRYDD